MYEEKYQLFSLNNWEWLSWVSVTPAENICLKIRYLESRQLYTEKCHSLSLSLPSFEQWLDISQEKMTVVSESTRFIRQFDGSSLHGSGICLFLVIEFIIRLRPFFSLLRKSFFDSAYSEQISPLIQYSRLLNSSATFTFRQISRIHAKFPDTHKLVKHLKHSPEWGTRFSTCACVRARDYWVRENPLAVAIEFFTCYPFLPGDEKYSYNRRNCFLLVYRASL